MGDEDVRFDPSDLELTTTPASVSAAVRDEEYARALPMSLCLNEPALIRAVWCAVPPAQLPLVAQTLPAPYLERFMRFLAAELESTRHFHLLLLWVQQLL